MTNSFWNNIFQFLLECAERVKLKQGASFEASKRLWSLHLNNNFIIKLVIFISLIKWNIPVCLALVF